MCAFVLGGVDDTFLDIGVTTGRAGSMLLKGNRLLFQLPPQVMEAILHIVVTPARQELGNECPLGPHLCEQTTYEGVLHRGPPGRDDCRNEMVHIALSALLPGPMRDEFGHVGPLDGQGRTALFVVPTLHCLNRLD